MKAISVAVLLGLLCCTTASAQVYRCELEGKTIYSDAPCLGAKRVDTTPTQGMDKLSGRSRKSAEVRRDEHQKMVTEALRPFHGMSHQEMSPRYRRSQNRLTPAEHAECEALDGTIKQLEQREGSAQGDALKRTQMQLLQQRQRYKELNC